MRRGSLLGVLLAGLLAGPASAAGLNVAVVHIQQVMEAVPEWTKTVEALKKDWQQKEAKLKAEQAALREKKEQLDAKRIVSDPATIAKEEAALLEDAQKLAATFMRQQTIITQTESELKSQMLKRVERVVYDLAKAKEYTYVFEAGTEGSPNVLYSQAGLDVTKEVIAAYKKAFKDTAFELPKIKAPEGP